MSYSNVNINAVADSFQRELFATYLHEFNPFISACLVLQNAYETKISGGAIFASNVFRTCNNLGGITFNSSMNSGVKYGVRVARGSSRGKDEGGVYVYFNSIKDCKTFIINMYKFNYADATAAANLATFVKLIKLKGYFTAPEETYLSNMNGVKSHYLDPYLKSIIDNPRDYFEDLEGVSVKGTIKKNWRK